MIQSSADFAAKLRSLRKGRVLSLRKLAAEIGVSPVTVWKWEGGDTVPRPRSIGRLANALGVDPVDFFTNVVRPPAPIEPNNVKYIAPPNCEVLPAAAAPQMVENNGVLQGVITHEKRRVAEAAGVRPEQVTIQIKY